MQNRKDFFALLGSGLWKQDVRLLEYGEIDFSPILRMAREQSVVGLVTAGLYNVTDVNVPYETRLIFVGSTLPIEHRNAAINDFVVELVLRLQEVGIKAVLLKGQGIAQCYAKPQWRSSGDVDLLLDEDNYEKAKDLLLPMASETGKEFEYNLHQSLTIGAYTVELHGSQRCGLSGSMDEVIDEVQQEVCQNGKVRTWMNGNVPIYLPAPDEDVILVFTHFLKHFYKGGLGLRQICDWCRLLWTHRKEIDRRLLEERLNRMGLMTEWKAFGAFAVVYLGMPVEAMPLYDDSRKWKRKAKRIESFVIKSGNFGHNRVVNNFDRSYVFKKAQSMWRRLSDLFNHTFIFPLDSLRFMPTIMIQGFKSAERGE